MRQQITQIIGWLRRKKLLLPAEVDLSRRRAFGAAGLAAAQTATGASSDALSSAMDPETLEAARIGRLREVWGAMEAFQQAESGLTVNTIDVLIPSEARHYEGMPKDRSQQKVAKYRTAMEAARQALIEKVGAYQKTHGELMLGDMVDPECKHSGVLKIFLSRWAGVNGESLANAPIEGLSTLQFEPRRLEEMSQLAATCDRIAEVHHSLVDQLMREHSGMDKSAAESIVTRGLRQVFHSNNRTDRRTDLEAAKASLAEIKNNGLKLAKDVIRCDAEQAMQIAERTAREAGLNADKLRSLVEKNHDKWGSAIEMRDASDKVFFKLSYDQDKAHQYLDAINGAINIRNRRDYAKIPGKDLVSIEALPPEDPYSNVSLTIHTADGETIEQTVAKDAQRTQVFGVELSQEQLDALQQFAHSHPAIARVTTLSDFVRTDQLDASPSR